MSIFQKNILSSPLALLDIRRKFSPLITISVLLTVVKSQLVPFSFPDNPDGYMDPDNIQKMEDLDERDRDIHGLDVCGTIYTTAGDQVTFFRDDLALSQKMFEIIHVKQLKNALFQPNVEKNCVIQVCGYTSYGKRKDDKYIGSDEDYAGCLTVDSNTTARKVLFFNHHKRNCTSTCKTDSVNHTRPWSKNECARLYQEKACNTCYFDDILLSNGQNYTTDNSEHVLSMIVRDKCEVQFRSPAFKKMYWFKDLPQPIIYKSGSITDERVVSAFQSEPEYFYCACDSQPSPPSTPTPYPVTMPPHNSSDGIATTARYAVGGVGAFSVVVLIFTGIAMSKQKKGPFFRTTVVNSESQETITTIAETTNEGEPAAVVSADNDGNVCVDNDIIRNVPCNNGFETFPELFEVQEVIGQGHFGQVSIGALKVAIKTVKADISSSDRATCIKSLNQEIKILSYLGSHPNVVRFQNAYIGDYLNGEIFLILEFCQGGSLESHLKSTVAPRIQEILCQHDLERMRRAAEDNGYSVNMLNVDSVLPNHNIDNKNDLEKLEQETLRQLYKWCSQIACGMMHIQSKNIVHVDLATRNVLLTSNLVAKIADFGLSKKVYIKDYASNGKDSLPIRWVAPEFLTEQRSTSKSDVWSFGVTTWEIFNLGKVPYEDLNCAQVITSIIRGERLDCPRYATEAVYSKLMDCWNECPDRRPSFESLQKYFDCKMQKVGILAPN